MHGVELRRKTEERCFFRQPYHRLHGKCGKVAGHWRNGSRYCRPVLFCTLPTQGIIQVRTCMKAPVKKVGTRTELEANSNHTNFLSFRCTKGPIIKSRLAGITRHRQVENCRCTCTSEFSAAFPS